MDLTWTLNNLPFRVPDYDLLLMYISLNKAVTDKSFGGS